MQKADVGVIGLAVMGQNLALNIESRGYRVAVYNRTASRTSEFVSGPGAGRRIEPVNSIEEFVNMLAVPRRIILMVQAGSAVDTVIEQLQPLLQPGDVIMDGGNSFFADTRRRLAVLAECGIHYLGTGISGGEEGALKGPSIMPGGPPEAWEIMGKLLLDISAKVDGEPCCTYLGPDGIGHFVKMVHNGIEYGDMQLICEAYYLMREVLHLSHQEMSEIFTEWNRHELQSYLVEITADILKRVDEETGKPLVELIQDEAGQKGTGKWTSQESLDLGVPAPTIAEAVFARYISAQKDERLQAAAALPGPAQAVECSLQVSDIKDALYAAKICSYAQGFALLKKAALEYGWNLNLGDVALVWRGGCIIRAQFLNRIAAAYKNAPQLQNLLLDDYFRAALTTCQAGWRKVVSTAALCGAPTPGFSSALVYFDSYRSDRLPANLLQAQRDYFGAHTYKRVDKPAVFHTNWI